MLQRSECPLFLPVPHRSIREGDGGRRRMGGKGKGGGEVRSLRNRLR